MGNTIDELKVLCEPLMVMHLVLSDEETFIKNKAKFVPQPNEEIFKSFSLANFVFDKIISQPFYIPDLKKLLGANFIELFESTFKKLNKSEWIEFGVESYIPKEKKEKVEKLIAFVQDYKTVERRIIEQRDNTSAGIPPPYEMMVYSKVLDIPLFSIDSSIKPPNFGTKNESSRQGQTNRFEILNVILEFELPNLKITTLDELLDVRETKGSKEFRRVFNEFFKKFIHNDNIELTEILKEWNYLKSEALDLLIQEFKSSIKNWETMKIGSSIAMNLAGFIPGLSLITGSLSTLKDSQELINQLAKQKRAKEFSLLCFITETRKKFK